MVIPCHDEPDLTRALDSLWECQRPSCAVEVIVVFNSASEDLRARSQNRQTRADAENWVAVHVDSSLRFHLLDFPDLPRKQAGVGLARKIGLDEAAWRFELLNRPNGILVCFDADCCCARDYLLAIERHFQNHLQSPGCSIYFEHSLAGEFDPRIYNAVAIYELHLRYYIQGLRFARFPHAFHTIGSAMAFRSDIYQQQGGMNKRQAGEDFYFLHKIILLGEYTDLNDTVVFPSPRPSDRVPFGTGRAVRNYLASPSQATYPFAGFLDLKLFLENIHGVSPAEWKRDRWPETIRTFLAEQQFDSALEEIASNTATAANFRGRFFRWFNGFRAMKFIHHARDCFYGPAPIEQEASKLLASLRSEYRSVPDVRQLLDLFRKLDRLSHWTP